MRWEDVTKLKMVCPKHGEVNVGATMGGNIVCSKCCQLFNHEKDISEQKKIMKEIIDWVE